MSLDLRDKHDRISDLPDDGGLLGGPRWTAIGAVMVVGLIVALGIWLAVTSDDDEPASAARSSTTLAPATSAPAFAGAECPEMATSTEVPTAPPKAEWKIVYTVALPFSETAGPAVVEGDVARCYAHSPEGALFAAVQIPIRSIAARDGERVVREQTVPGAGQEALVTVLKRRGWSPARPGELCQIAGFNVASYTPERAVVSIAARCANGLQLTQGTVIWSGGDWREELLPDGSNSATASALPNLAGMVPWGGV